MYRTEIIQYAGSKDRDTKLYNFVREGYKFIGTVCISTANFWTTETITLKEGKEDDRLESKEFYDLMQNYRHISSVDQKLVIERFEEVKTWIRINR